MSLSPKLKGVLLDDEIESIPENLRTKLNDHIFNLQQVIDDLKNENAEIVAVSDRQQFQFEKEIFESQAQLKESTESCVKLKELVAELEENLNSVKKELRETQSSFNSANLELQSLRKNNELLQQEKRELAEQLEKRRNDIEKLNEELRNLLQQTTAATEEKNAAIAKAEEAEMHESKHQHQVNRLEQEKTLLERQISDLTMELSQKNHEVHTLKREKSTIVLELQTQLEHRSDEVFLLEKQLVMLKESIEDKDARIQTLAEKIRSIEEKSIQIEQQYNVELQAKSKLVDLYEKASESNQNRVKELVSAFEQAQKVLQALSEEKALVEKNLEMAEEEFKLKIKEKDEENCKLREELKHANEMCQGKFFTSASLESMFPTAAATSKVLHSGLTLTQLYSEYVKSQEEIQNLKEENLRNSEQLKRILSEIEENTPVITERMKEYHKSLETVSCLRTQLASALTDYEAALSEKLDLQRKANKFDRENHRLKLQVSDLNHQVQVLLKEVEEARGGLVKLGEPDDMDVTSTNDITADKVISRHLVTFRDIVELQSKNQKLLAVVRELSEDQERQEKKLNDEKNAELQEALKQANSQLEELQKNRIQQTELIESVVRQRDMYRVLLTHHGVSESLLGSPQGSSAHGTSLLSSGDHIDISAKSALQQLQSEFDNYKKEKAENERMLTEQLDKAKSEISDFRIENTKLSSKVEYSEERIGILNSSVETYKKEASFVREKNQQYSTLITQHQQTIQSLKHELMIAHEKIAKYEVMVENLKTEKEMLKNVEQRLLHEKESIFREQQQKSQVLANLQSLQNNLERIESESKRAMQSQIDKYEKENNILKAKVDSANEDYRSAVALWEKQNRDLQKKIDAEVEKNHKLHEDLVDAYSKVHTINQELMLLKAANQSGAKSDKASSSPSKSEMMNASQVKQLKEQLNESQARSRVLQEQLDIARKSSDQYMKMCHDLELRIKELDEINNQLKSSMESALQNKDDAKRHLEQNIEDLEKTHRGLLEENMKLAQYKEGRVVELETQVVALQKEIESNKDVLETAKRTADLAREDCLAQKKNMEEAQERYEREVLLHAEDIQTLTLLKEEHKKCGEQAAHLQSLARKSEDALNECKSSWQEQEQLLAAEQSSLKERLKELEMQNNNLLEQLELMGTQLKALQSKDISQLPDISSDVKDTQQLLEVIRFVKKEKEIASTQYESALSENIRLKLKNEQLLTDLNEAKNELKELQNTAQVRAVSEAQHSELLRKVEMMNLLTESNSLLRIEKANLLEAKEQLESKVGELEKQIEPLVDKNNEMKSKLEQLLTENEALQKDVKSWQSRTNQLLEQSHRIGPQEYKNLTRELEELKSQKARIADELQRKQTEVSSLNTNLHNIQNQLESVKSELSQQISIKEKLQSELNEQQKTMLQVKKIGRKYKTQYDEVKAAYDALLGRTKMLESLNQDQTVQEMQKKLADGEKVLKELREESDKQKESSLKSQKEYEEALKEANEKNEKAKKILAQARQRINQVTSQKNSMIAELEQVKSENTTLKNASGEDSCRIAALKSQYDAKIAHLEADLKAARENGDNLKKQCDELCQKMALQQKQGSKPTAVGGKIERGSTEPLTANIKPLSPAQASGSGLRPIAIQTSRSTPTASIRPMAIGPVATTNSSQARMAAVLPTTATTSVLSTSSDEATIPVPQATVQPTLAAVTVALTTVSPTITPSSHTLVISELSQTASAPAEPPPAQILIEPVQSIHMATALVCPRVEEVSEPAPIDGPAPTTSVIVSPPATQTQLVTPTIKRKLDESPGSDSADGNMNMQKRVRMISEGSQTNQQTASASASPSIAAASLPSAVTVVPVATVVSRSKVDVPTSEVAPSIHVEVVESLPLASAAPTVVQPSSSSELATTTAASESKPLKTEDKSVEEIIDAEEDKNEQSADWEAPEGEKSEGDFEVMDDDDQVEQVEEFDDEPVQPFTAPAGEDEDMVEDSTDNIDIETPAEVPGEMFDTLEGNSDNQMEADNNSNTLPVPSNDQLMAPPASPMTQATEPADTVPDTVIEPVSQSRRGSRQQRFPMRQECVPSAVRQHLTPFTIQGHGPGFEDGDDSIVPSTPTLIVPRRADGFAEVISPHVPPVRFSFNSTESSPTQQGLSQLETQGGLGVDDTRMDLSQFDEGSGRTVPSTPLQVSPPDENSLSVVPEIIEPTDIDSGGDAGVPTIRIESVQSLAGQNTDNIEISQTSSEQDQEAPVSQATKSEDSSAVALASTSSASVEPEGLKKEPMGAEGDTSSQVPPTSSIRKPIIWEKEIAAAPISLPLPTPVTVAPTTSTTSASQFSPPVVGEQSTRAGRARRFRYRGTTSSNFGRGTTSWLPRRGRGTTRRGRMF